MNEIKALKELKEYIAEKLGCGDYGMRMCDLVGDEVRERFIEMPVDADGVPIHVGDMVAEKPFRPNMGEKPAEVVCMLLNSDGWAIGDCDPRGHWYGPLQLEHAKPRTVEDVLERFGDAIVHCITKERAEEAIALYAAEIREVMRDDR